MAWLQLIRLALLPTIVWDFVAGFILLQTPWITSLGYGLLSLLCLYHGGMVLNDVRDLPFDRQHQRHRPLVMGKIAPLPAFLFSLFLFTGAFCFAHLSSPNLAQPTLWLFAIILAYDLSGPNLRAFAGPALLAAARAFSFCFAAFVVHGDRAILAMGYLPLLSYALYFLFLSRLAQTEEQGIPGMRGLSMLLMAAVSPFLLLYTSPITLSFLPVLLLFATYLLQPAWKHRHLFWQPEQVQLFVRRSLGAGPMVVGLALLTQLPFPQACLGFLSLGVSFLVGFLATTWAPE